MKEIKNFKICHVSTNYNSKAGITRRTNLIVEALKNRGYSVTLICGPNNDLKMQKRIYDDFFIATYFRKT